MLYLQNVCKAITVRINSEGGSVLDGYSIASSIYNSKVPVTTIDEGLAASTAMWCLAAGTPGLRKAMDYSTGMAHEVSGANDKEMSDMVNKTISVMLSNRSSKTEAEAASMMAKETWLTANEMKAAGFVDEVVSTGLKVKPKKSESLENIALMYNEFIKPKNMGKLNTLLKISNNADESEQETAVAKLNADLAKANSDLAIANEKLKALEDEKAAKELSEKASLKNKAEVLVNKACVDKKITDSEKVNYLEKASNSQADFDFVSNVLAKMGSGNTAAKVFDPAKINNSVQGERSTWSWSDWSKKDPSGLDKIRNGNPEMYEEMYNAEFKK